MKNLINDFVSDLVDVGQEGWALSQMFLEEEETFHSSTYDITGIYDSCKSFLCKNYSDLLIDECIDMCPYDTEELILKIKNKYGECSTNRLALECLATIVLNEYQHYQFWYTIWGTEENCLLDFAKYNINLALYDTEDFPIIQRVDVVAAMMGVNDMVQPSDLYNVFAYYADELTENEEVTLLENDREPIFTPDPFEVAGVVARYKNYTDFINSRAKKAISEYAFKFNELLLIEDEIIRETFITANVYDEYMNRFNQAPNSLPLHKDTIKISIIRDAGENKIHIDYRIKGVKSKKICWDSIYSSNYEIPVSPLQYQKLILKIAIDFKKELNGMEKARGVDELSYSGKYPNRKSATHGLNFIKDMNVKVKDSRGRYVRKTPKASFNLALAEKQSLYIMKKSLRYADKNPVISSSFGIDSMVTHSLLRRVNKHNYNIVHNNSLVEYPQLISFKRKMIKEWDLSSKLIETLPTETYWQVKEKQGWNFARKGDRRNGTSTSEKCCEAIKHKPMYNQIDKFALENNPMQVNYTGLRGCESRSRMQQIKRDSIFYYAKMWKSLKASPIAWFTEEMIWEYVKKHKLPYCDIYDMKLYYEDVFDNVADDEIGKIYYQPRIGCYSCLLVAKNGYLNWLKAFLPLHYQFLMFKKGLAKDLFEVGAKKMGIITENISIVRKEKVTVNKQLSIFEMDDNKNSEEISLFSRIDTPITNEIIESTEDILETYSPEIMEEWIMRRPCKFLA